MNRSVSRFANGSPWAARQIGARVVTNHAPRLAARIPAPMFVVGTAKMSDRAHADLIDAILMQARLGGSTREAARALLSSLLLAPSLEGDEAAAAADGARTGAERIGALMAEAGDRIEEPVRRVLGLSRALASELHEGDPARAARRQLLFEEAAARAAEGFERAQMARREAWLSRLTHDIKGRLNIVNLNLWLLQQSSTSRDDDKFQKIERAIARTLELIKDVRELHERATAPVPGPSQPLASPPK